MLRRELPPSGDDETMAVRQPAHLTFTCRVVSCKPELDLPGNLQLTRLGRFNSPDSLSAKELGFDSSHQPAEAPGGQATSQELLTSSPNKPRNTRPGSPATFGFRRARPHDQSRDIPVSKVRMWPVRVTEQSPSPASTHHFEKKSSSWCLTQLRSNNRSGSQVDSRSRPQACAAPHLHHLANYSPFRRGSCPSW